MKTPPSARGLSMRGRVMLFAAIVFLAGGVLAALLLFDVFDTRTRVPEPTASLRGWNLALHAYYERHQTYSPDIARVGFSPERGNRYACFSGPGPLEDRSGARTVPSPEARGIAVDTLRFPDGAVTFQQLPESVASQLGVVGQCPRCGITLACAARLHPEAPLDIWTLSTVERTLSDETVIAPDEIHHDLDGR